MIVESKKIFIYRLSQDEVQKAIIDFMNKTHDIDSIYEFDFGWHPDQSCQVTIIDSSTEDIKSYD